MSEVFTPSLARRGFDELLVRFPHLDVVNVSWAETKEAELISQPWVLVTLGQPSQGEILAWARWQFAIWKPTGSVYRMEHGAVEDDPYITVSDEEER